MGLEAATYVADLVSSNPVAADARSQGDDHLRLIKAALQTTFPAASKPFYFPVILTKTANYTILSANENTDFLGDATAGNFTLTLPTLGAGQGGWAISVIKTDATANTVILGGTINGAVNFSLTKQYQGMSIFWSGTAWFAFHTIRNIAGLPTLDALSVIGNATIGGTLGVTGATTLTGILTQSSTAHEIAPGGTTAQRSGTTEKQFRVNTDTNSLEAYLNASWRIFESLGNSVRGMIDGLEMSNGADTTNDINLQPGSARDATNTITMTVATALGKQLDADWAAGGTTGVPTGGRNKAAGIANGTYHAYLVAPASGVANLYFKAGVAGTDPDSAATIAAVITSIQAEVGGATYIYARCIGSIVRAAAAILQFDQEGDDFILKTARLDVDNSGDHTTAVLQVMSVPIGCRVMADLRVGCSNGGANSGVLVTSPSTTDVVPVAGAAPGYTVPGSAGSVVWIDGLELLTDSSGQIRYRSNAATVDTLILLKGWRHNRGRNAP